MKKEKKAEKVETAELEEKTNKIVESEKQDAESLSSVETEGKNVEQAIELALFKLSAKREEVKIQILEKGGLFSKAKVRVFLGKTGEVESLVEDVVNGLIEAMGIECFASVEEKEGKILIELSGNDVGVMIGKRGDIMDQLQFLISLLVNHKRKNQKPYRIVIDSANYRQRRESSLASLALRLADKAVREGKPVKLEPMSANERRIIHTALQGNLKVRTESKGEEPNRYLSIFPEKSMKRTDGSVANSKIENSPIIFPHKKGSGTKRDYND